MALRSHHAEGDEVAPTAADCTCRPEEGGTRQARRVLFFICAGPDTAVSKTADRIQKKPPCGVGVEVVRPQDVREAQERARGEFSGESDRVIVVIDFDPGGQDCLEAAKTLALSHPVLAFFATDEGAAAQLQFMREVERCGGALGRFETCQLGQGSCLLRGVYGRLRNECERA